MGLNPAPHGAWPPHAALLQPHATPYRPIAAPCRPTPPHAAPRRLSRVQIVSMVSPVPLGMWAERYGERHVYVGVTLMATLSAVVLAGLSTHPVVFALSWALLSAPISLRGVRAAYFARHVPPEELSRGAPALRLDPSTPRPLDPSTPLALDQPTSAHSAAYAPGHAPVLVQLGSSPPPPASSALCSGHSSPASRTTCPAAATCSNASSPWLGAPPPT